MKARIAVVAALGMGTVACARPNPAYGDRASAGATTRDSEADASTTDPVETAGTEGQSGSTSATGPDPDPVTSSGGSSTGDAFECSPNGFKFDVVGLACTPNERFFTRACAEFEASDVFEDGLRAETTVACGANEVSCQSAGLSVLGVDVRAEGHDLPNLVLPNLSPDPVANCGSIWFSGVGTPQGECLVDAVYVWDEGDHGLVIAFNNRVTPSPELAERLATFIGVDVTPFEDNTCGEPTGQCDADAAFYTVVLDGHAVPPDGEEVEFNVFVDANGDGTPDPRTMDVYNFGSRIDRDCAHHGKWAIAWDGLDYDFQP